MKILVVSNLYPPHFIGGYELGCRDVVEGLRVRGHAVEVLAGDFRNADGENDAPEPGVNRTLRFWKEGRGALRDHFAECRKLGAVLDRFAPDVVYFWNQGGLCPWLPVAARWRGLRVAFFLSDTNFISWRVGAWLGGAARRFPALGRLVGRTFLVQGRPVMEGHVCHFASEFLLQTAREARIHVAPESVVAHWGISPAQFTARNERARWPVRRLLYVGQLSPLKGVHTAVAALGELAARGETALQFCMVGGGTNRDYEDELRGLAVRLGVADRVEFRGRVARTDLPGIYAEHDLLVFPSEWAEPFAITPLEAMASGLAVVGTTTGGSGELLRDRETALTFRAGDVADCARALGEACRDRELFETIRANGQREVLQNYTLERMIAQVESSLLALAARSRR